MKNVIFVSALMMLFLTSCSDEEIDTTPQTGFSIQEAVTLNKPASDNKSLKNPLNQYVTFTKVMIGVRDIEIKTENESHYSYGFEGSYQFDVLNGTSTPAIKPVSMEPGMYNKLEFKIDNNLSGGNSIEIYGTFKNELITFDFEYTTDLEGEFEVENENGLQLKEGDITQFILLLDLKELLKGIDINSIQFDNDNVLRLNASSNADCSKTIKENLKRIMKFEHKGHDE